MTTVTFDTWQQRLVGSSVNGSQSMHAVSTTRPVTACGIRMATPASLLDRSTVTPRALALALSGFQSSCPACYQAMQQLEQVTA